jgi:hypothetical protein
MCSQSGNIQDLSACSGHSPTPVFGSDPEPNSTSSRQDYANQQSCSDMGLRYMTIPNADDVRYVMLFPWFCNFVCQREAPRQFFAAGYPFLPFSCYAFRYRWVFRHRLDFSEFDQPQRTYPSWSILPKVAQLKPHSAQAFCRTRHCREHGSRGILVLQAVELRWPVLQICKTTHGHEYRSWTLVFRSCCQYIGTFVLQRRATVKFLNFVLTVMQ